jgi:hypothetical protein
MIDSVILMAAVLQNLFHTLRYVQFKCTRCKIKETDCCGPPDDRCDRCKLDKKGCSKKGEDVLTACVHFYLNNTSEECCTDNCPASPFPSTHEQTPRFTRAWDTAVYRIRSREEG